MNSSPFSQLILSLIVKAYCNTPILFALCILPFALKAQSDPLGSAAASTVHDAASHSAKMQMRATKASAAIKTKLSQFNSTIANKKLNYKVAYTEAMDRTKRNLVGTKPPKKVSVSAISSQAVINYAVVSKANVENARENVAVPNTHNYTNPPASWWKPNWYTEIKDQGSCGSCWTFATAAAYEHTFKKLYGASRDIDVAEQYLLDCSDAGSCDGGTVDGAMDYIRVAKCASESVAPYKGTVEACGTGAKTLRAYTWGQLPYNAPVDTIKKYLMAYGSLAIYMKAGIDDFYAYSTGVYDGYPSNSDDQDVDHAVTLVGWYEPMHAWIIKNSWGKTWGYSGYGYVNYNACNIAKYAFYIYPINTARKISTEHGTEEKPFESPIRKENKMQFAKY